MATWITSDLHFSHANIQKFCPATRGHYRDVDDMNEQMILEWNSKVASTDVVYILGDIAFCSADKASEIVNRLNGSKHLIVGNHDEKNLKNARFRECFASVQHYLRLVYNKQLVIMCHFPIYDHDQAGRGSLMLHGHLHGTPHPIPGRIKDVGMDATGEIVCLLDSIIEEMVQIPPIRHH